jgi:type III restriction enzyme
MSTASKKSKTELFGKHPLAKAIEPVVKEWSESNYPTVNGKQISDTTRELFNWWFSDQVHEPDSFHSCQRRALETLVYCYEILDIPLVESLFEIFSSALLEKENLKKGIEKIGHPRFGIKMATGTGKTWVITAIIVWQYWNRVRTGDKRFASHFLLCAPGNIVYERLLDSFNGRKARDGKRRPDTADIRKPVFMPEAWRDDFNLKIFSKEDLQESSPVTESPFILITNWHQLMDTTKQREDTLAESLGIDMKSDTISLRVERFMNFLTFNNDLVIINDEAHHVQNASDAEQKRWQESIEVLRKEIQARKENVFVQYDFTATPFVIKGKRKEFFPHVIYDYGLVEAMRNMLVKQIFIEKSSLLSEKIEKLPPSEIDITGHRDEVGNPLELSETQKHMLDVGLAKLDNLKKEFVRLKIQKKPVMFVIGDQNAEADLIAQYIKNKTDGDGRSYGDETNGEQVVTIHEGRKSNLSDDDYEKLRTQVFTSDDPDNPTRIIVSVLMLREGFDVKNVCVLVVLRRSDSDLLTEQVIGRGIRQMFPEMEYYHDKLENIERLRNRETLINSYDLLFVVEHPKYNEIYTQLTEAGALIASGSSLEISLDAKSVLISADPQRIEKYDLAWPVYLSYRTDEDLNFKYFDIAGLPRYEVPFDRLEPTRIVITDYHPDTKFKQDWELKEANFSYQVFLRNLTKNIIGTSRKNVWISRYSTDIVQILDQYISEHLFGRLINFNDESNVKKMRNQQLYDFIAKSVRIQLQNFIKTAQSQDVIEAEWVRLSNYKDLKVRMERSISTRKCIYPNIDFPYKGGFERKFTEDQLENDASVETYVKLNQYVHGFSVPYINSQGYLVQYYPDFLVKMKDFMLIVETKSEKEARTDTDVKRKALAAEKRCIELSKIRTLPPINQPKLWRYILLPQDIYNDMEGQSLRAIIDRCENNLELLKMQRE